MSDEQTDAIPEAAMRAAEQGTIENARKRGWRGNDLEAWALKGDARAALAAAVPHMAGSGEAEAYMRGYRAAIAGLSPLPHGEAAQRDAERAPEDPVLKAWDEGRHPFGPGTGQAITQPHHEPERAPQEAER